VEWVGAGQRIVALHTASLLICVFSVELQKLDAKAATWPTDEFFGVEAGIENQQPVKAPLARIYPA
jgi:hypothetical protein